MHSSLGKPLLIFREMVVFCIFVSQRGSAGVAFINPAEIIALIRPRRSCVLHDTFLCKVITLIDLVVVILSNWDYSLFIDPNLTFFRIPTPSRDRRFGTTTILSNRTSRLASTSINPFLHTYKSSSPANSTFFNQGSREHQPQVLGSRWKANILSFLPLESLYIKYA